MARTTRRQTFNVPTGSGNYSKPQFFNQVEFKGLCTNKNDVTIDQETFVDTKNVFVNEDGVLVSRPPFNFDGNECYIINEWQFAEFPLRLYRLLYTVEDESGSKYDYYHFVLQCTNKEIYNHVSWGIPTSTIDEDFVPKVVCTPIEDKIFVWFAGIDFVALNIPERRFEDAAKYIHLPIHELVTNGLGSELESENFLTDTYRRRYLYSTVSNVDFSKLQGKKNIRVNLSGNTDGDEYLYDIEHWWGKDREDLLIYPYSYIGESVDVDIASTPRGTVYLRYTQSLSRVEVSFDGKTFQRLPQLDGIIGIPRLTRDGFDVMAFTRNGLARCRIVQSSMSDTSELFTWSLQSYSIEHMAIVNICGYFETANDYVFVLKDNRQITIKAKYGSLSKSITISSGSSDYFAFTNDVKPLLLYIPPSGTYFAGDTPYLFVFIPYIDVNNKTCFCAIFSDTIAAYSKNELTEHKFPTSTNTLTVRSVLASDAYIAGYRRLISEDTSDVLLAQLDIYVPTVLNTDCTVGRYDVRRRMSVSIDIYNGYSPVVNIGGTVDENVNGVLLKNSNNIKVRKDFIGEQQDVSAFVTKQADYITDTYCRLDDAIFDLPTNGKLSDTVKREPLLWDSTGITYNIDGYLWLSQLMQDTVLELDEWVNAGSALNELVVNIKNNIPTHFVTMNEHYFAFASDNINLLEVTSARYDDTDFLLYLPKQNEQVFTNKITNLHPLSNTEIGVFTENEIWYVTNTVGETGEVFYTKPIKSKLPFGCRDGSDVVTALDGQAIIFATERGITALAPQDFIATTEKTLTYLSDTIQGKYESFYNNSVFNAMSVSKVLECKPFIKITTHKYWIMFYKYMDREILLLDTRGGTWWTLITPYPIRSVSNNSVLQILMHIDYLPTEKKSSLLGVPFSFGENDGYFDDVIDNTLSGDSELLFENKFIEERRILKRASSVIDWSFTSQKLHFGQINNYKAIKAKNMNLRGDDVNAKLYTKAYRDAYHPEQEDVVEIKINELCTFVKRFNLMHILDFQYRIENDREIEIPHQFQLNSLSLKYEVKEGVR